MYAGESKLQKELASTINKIDQTCLRKLQADMHRCAANCCEDRESSVEVVARCVENCGASLRSAQTLVQNQFDNFRERIQRCYMTCNDKISDKLSSNPSESEIEQYKQDLIKCQTECDDAHIDIVFQMFKKTKEAISKGGFYSGY